MTSLDVAFGASAEQAQAQAQAQAPVPVAAPTAPPPPPPPPMDELKTPYGRVLAQLVRFVSAVQLQSASGNANGGGDPEAITAAVREKWNAIPAPKTNAELHAAVTQMYAMNLEQFARTLAACDSSMRLYFHGQGIKLAQAVRADTDELAFASATMRWLLQQALPSLATQPEEAKLGTVKELRRNYAALDATCKVARPDDSNPVLVAASHNLAEAQQAIHVLKHELKRSEARAKRVGLDFSSKCVTESTGDDDVLHGLDDAVVAELVATRSSTTRTTNVVLIVMFVLAVAAIIVLTVLLLRKPSPSPSPTPALAVGANANAIANTNGGLGGRTYRSGGSAPTLTSMSTSTSTSTLIPKPSVSTAYVHPSSFTPADNTSANPFSTHNWGFPPLESLNS
jgi:hypothetical protein